MKTPKITSLKHPWVWGQSPNPKSWYETAEILKGNQPKPKRASGLYERLQAIEAMMSNKEKP